MSLSLTEKQDLMKIIKPAFDTDEAKSFIKFAEMLLDLVDAKVTASSDAATQLVSDLEDDVELWSAGLASKLNADLGVDDEDYLGLNEISPAIEPPSEI